MMSTCLAKLLTADAQVRLLIYPNENTFYGVEYTPLMYKIIMSFATINSVTTIQTLRNNLQSLGVYAATVNGDINKVHNEFDKNYSQLIAGVATVDDPICILFEAYLVVPSATSRHTFAVNTRIILMVNLPSSPTRPL
jgi:hypothetical protein